MEKENTVREIITDTEKLGTRVDEIDPRKQGKLVQEITLALKKVIREKNLTALSAPAIGYSYRIFCVSFDNGNNIRTFVNPIISNASGFELSREKCTSIPGKEFIRPRNNKITFMYMSPMGKIETRSVAGYTAKVIQHEIDHLDGLLLSDIGLEIDEQFDKASEEERLEVINAYLDALDIKRKTLDEEIKSDKDLSQLSDAIDFMTKVATGEVQAEPVAIDKDLADKIIKEKEQETKASDDTKPKEEEAKVPKKRGRKPKSVTDGDNKDSASDKA